MALALSGRLFLDNVPNKALQTSRADAGGDADARRIARSFLFSEQGSVRKQAYACQMKWPLLEAIAKTSGNPVDAIPSSLP